MTDQENHFTVFIRLPFRRGDFVDPPPVAWSATKERELWDIISRQAKGNQIDWKSLAEQFQVTQQFLLQQAAWLYERQLSQVRAQMRRMGTRQSATPSPAPSSSSASIMTSQPSKKPSAMTSRGPSRLSTQTLTTAAPAETSVPNTPARSRTSLPFKQSTSGVPTINTRVQTSSSRPLSRKPSKDNEVSSRTHSRRGSVQHQLTKSPVESRPAELTSSSEDETTTKQSHRRSNPALAQRRSSTMRRSQHNRTSSLGVHQLQEEREEDDDEDDPAFLPFANTSSKADSSTTAHNDPSATLRGDLIQHTPSTATRPPLQRNHTSERVKLAASTTATTAPAPTTTKPKPPNPRAPVQLTSSTSSLSSNNSPYPMQPLQHRPASQTPNPSLPAQMQRTGSNLPTPLSPLQQAALAQAAGLSPRRRSAPAHHHHTGSESSPSMGSSFSDLDDASVTQSALEEALMSNMGSTTAGGLGSRVSGISQALRSRYFDARGPGQGDGSQR